MRILIDADGCPVVAIAVSLARRYNCPCLIFCDTAHHIHHEGAETIMLSPGADSVDFALVNRIRPGDIVVTQDYGLAAMCLARQAQALNQNGLLYTADNIDALLLQRHTARKVRVGGGRLKGPSKRQATQDTAFAQALEQILCTQLNAPL